MGYSKPSSLVVGALLALVVLACAGPAFALPSSDADAEFPAVLEQQPPDSVSPESMAAASLASSDGTASSPPCCDGPLLQDGEGEAAEAESAKEKVPQQSLREKVETFANDPDPGLRRWAAERMGEQRNSQTFERLVETLDDQDHEVRQEALANLGQYGGEATEPLKDLLGYEQHPEVRAAAFQLLGQVGREEAVDVLLQGVADINPQIRLAAVEALGYAGGPAAKEALLARVADKDLAVRMAALRTLTFYFGEDLRKTVLEQSLYDEDEAAREYATRFLEIFTDRR